MHMRTSRVVPGRKDILILQPVLPRRARRQPALPAQGASHCLFIVGALLCTILPIWCHNIPQAQIVKAYGLFSEHEEKESQTDKPKARKEQRGNRPVGSKPSVQAAQERLGGKEEANI